MIMTTQKRLVPREPATGIRLSWVLVGFLVWIGALPTASRATPQFARQHQLRCTACHLLPPKLNEDGLAFQASGYRLPARLQNQKTESEQPAGLATIPLAVWITGRFEDQGAGKASDLFLPKVELISGGRVNEEWSYFIEWRVVSLSLNSDGSLKDRGGRFEDLQFQFFGERHSLKIGQYRTLNQIDVSLRLSPSDPLLFKNSLPTGTHDDPRIASLSRFSPSSRSPSLGYAFQSIKGHRASDGLFHYLTVPYIGEFSIPLSSEASETASFELAEPKGVFLETFYRKGHKSVGGHAFVEDDSWLLTALGTYDWKNLFVTAGLGVDDPGFGDTRQRSSLEVQYLVTGRRNLRAAAGLRIEEVSDDGKRTAYVPYFALAAPNTQHTFLLQLQYKNQEGSDSFVLDFSVLF